MHSGDDLPTCAHAARVSSTVRWADVAFCNVTHSSLGGGWEPDPICPHSLSSALGRPRDLIPAGSTWEPKRLRGTMVFLCAALTKTHKIYTHTHTHPPLIIVKENLLTHAEIHKYDILAVWSAAVFARHTCLCKSLLLKLFIDIKTVKWLISDCSAISEQPQRWALVPRVSTCAPEVECSLCSHWETNNKKGYDATLKLNSSYITQLMISPERSLRELCHILCKSVQACMCGEKHSRWSPKKCLWFIWLKKKKRVFTLAWQNIQIEPGHSQFTRDSHTDRGGWGGA